jgi:hypothetical protein
MIFLFTMQVNGGIYTGMPSYKVIDFVGFMASYRSLYINL